MWFENIHLTITGENATCVCKYKVRGQKLGSPHLRPEQILQKQETECDKMHDIFSSKERTSVSILSPFCTDNL